MDNYDFIENLGDGSYGTVTKWKDKQTGEIVAIKKMKKKYITWEECINLREVKSLNIVKHENIIKLKEMKKIDDTLYLIFEFMDRNLYEMMNKTSKFTESQIRAIMFQTLSGLAYMHKYGFFHRDLKPENLLVNNEKVKIADFGLAREIRSIPPYTEYVSTRWYRAPECLLKSTNYNSQIDIWALGCIFAEMYNLKPIFTGTSESKMLYTITSILGTPTSWTEGLILAKKIDFKFPNIAPVNLAQLVPSASNEAIDLLTQMLQWDPANRPSAAALLNHPYFTKFPVPKKITSEIDVANSASMDLSEFKVYVKKPPKQQVNKTKNEKVQVVNDDINKMLEDTVGFNKRIFNFLKKFFSYK